MSVSLTKLDVNTQKDEIIARLLLQRAAIQSYAIHPDDLASPTEAQFALEHAVPEDLKAYPNIKRIFVYIVNSAKSEGQL